MPVTDTRSFAIRGKLAGAPTSIGCQGTISATGNSVKLSLAAVYKDKGPTRCAVVGGLTVDDLRMLRRMLDVAESWLTDKGINAHEQSSTKARALLLSKRK